MDKVKITQELADAIELMRIKGCPSSEIVERHCDKELIQVNGWEHVAELSTDFLIRALYIGYEVEETPEDKLKAYWDELKQNLDECHPENTARIHIDGRMLGMHKTLELLGIKIVGVNHE